MKKLCLFISAVLSALIGLSCATFQKLFHTPNRSKIHYIRDADDRIVIYHGVNVSNFSKQAPDQISWHQPEDLLRLSDWGFNLVRYLVFWEAVEPEPGKYNDAYMQETIKRIKFLRNHDIDVVLDFHQDLYAQKFTGNGFPSWTIRDDDLEFIPRQPWAMNYLTGPVAACFTNFWKSEELKKSYVKALEYVLSQVTDLDNVIGIDAINEPFPGLTVSFESKTLTEFYGRIQKMMKVRGFFKQKLFFEPVIYTSTGIATNLKFKGENSVYFPHYYDEMCARWHSYSTSNYKIMRKAFQIKLMEACEFGCPLIYGEFGIQPSVSGYTAFLKDFTDISDEYCTGWAYWSYDMTQHNDFGIINDQKLENTCMKILVRVYPQRIAGRNPKFGIKGNRFELTYETLLTNAPTIIFIPELNGVEITVNGAVVPYTGKRLFKYQNDSHSTQKIEVVWKL